MVARAISFLYNIPLPRIVSLFLVRDVHCARFTCQLGLITSEECKPLNFPSQAQISVAHIHGLRFTP